MVQWGVESWYGVWSRKIELFSVVWIECRGLVVELRTNVVSMHYDESEQKRKVFFSKQEEEKDR